MGRGGDSWALGTRVHMSDEGAISGNGGRAVGSEARGLWKKNLGGIGFPLPKGQPPDSWSGGPGMLNQWDVGRKRFLQWAWVCPNQAAPPQNAQQGWPYPRGGSTPSTIQTYPASLFTPQAPLTLKRGVRTTAPALPNSKAVSSWGSTLCRQKSSGNESRLLLSSWKNFCFSAGSLIWGSNDRMQGGNQPGQGPSQPWARTGGHPQLEGELKLELNPTAWVQIPAPPFIGCVTLGKSLCL